MDEPIQNKMIRLLREKVGHGGFLCSLGNPRESAEFTCGVPWKQCTISARSAVVGTSGLFFIFIRIPGSSECGFRRSKRINLYEPTFDPSKAVDDLVEIIKLLKEGFKRQKKLKLGMFPNSILKKIDAIWLEIGRTENA